MYLVNAFMHNLIHDSCRKYLRLFWEYGFSLPGRFFHPWDLEETIIGKHSSSILQDKGSWIQDQVGEFNYDPFPTDYTTGNGDQLGRYDTQVTFFQGQGPQEGIQKDHASWDGDIEMTGEFHWKDSDHFFNPPVRPIDVEEVSGVEEQLYPYEKFMDIDCDPDRLGYR
ncbi:hypothetical protein AYI68_g2662 [Smittium mucronatum]|uniref:Uncharacterized protein n=1 Tax=Smittium mucronatum TaxID=133383 RepID=A0A1R0H229_9FUNG|nr:hypothetical protein AYI68_g2662 [Smittium mucronatum]